jgi:hypothetical protein
MIRVVHPGSRIPDPGDKMAPDPESRFRIRNTAVTLPIQGHILFLLRVPSGFFTIVFAYVV